MTALRVELVPATCWYSNVRSNVSAADWNLCKQFVRERSGARCEIAGCGAVGNRWPIECHEVWSYDEFFKDGEILRVQRLDGLIALCPACHEVKHIGRAEAMGHLDRAVLHLMSVNGWNRSVAMKYLSGAFQLWNARSQYDWKLDISYLTDVLGP